MTRPPRSTVSPPRESSSTAPTAPPPTPAWRCRRCGPCSTPSSTTTAGVPRGRFPRVTLTADHGEAFLQHGLLTHAAQVFEESVRIPLIVRLPGETRPRRVAAPVDLIDLGATLADLLGVGSTGDLQGRSLLPLLAGGTLAHRVIVSRTASERPTYGLVDGSLKLIHDPRFGATSLYDLYADPGETEDLSSRRPVTTELLRQSLYRWLRELDRGMPDSATEEALSAEDEAALRALGYLH